MRKFRLTWATGQWYKSKRLKKMNAHCNGTWQLVPSLANTSCCLTSQDTYSNTLEFHFPDNSWQLNKFLTKEEPQLLFPCSATAKPANYFGERDGISIPI